jgi:hypothetical protein
MQYEYTVKIFSMEDLEREGIVMDAQKNIVYACRPDGACAVRDVSGEQIEKLSGLFDKMGADGWELVQLVFRPLGIVSFWKRLLTEVREGDTHI